jgi:hypothetical protein
MQAGTAASRNGGETGAVQQAGVGVTAVRMNAAIRRPPQFASGARPDGEPQRPLSCASPSIGGSFDPVKLTLALLRSPIVRSIAAKADARSGAASQMPVGSPDLASLSPSVAEEQNLQGNLTV